jgi:hypothetical protein
MAFTSEAVGLLRVDAARQPHNSVDAEVVAQALLDLLARELRVARGVQILDHAPPDQ